MAFPRPLEGIRVLDFTWLRSGPWGTRWLGALGAEVMKIQWTFAPGQRGVVVGAGGAPVPDPNANGNFADTNADKLSVTVNVRSEKGFELVKRLVAASDVVVENFTATVLKRWGLSYEEMKEINPGIVYVSMAGFGHTGPQSAYMIVGQATQSLSGLTFLSGLPGKTLRWLWLLLHGRHGGPLRDDWRPDGSAPQERHWPGSAPLTLPR